MIDSAKVAAELSLLERLRAGEQAAWTEFFATAKPVVYQALLYTVRDHHAAEDLTLEAFARAARGINRFRGGCQLKSWLCCIGRNLARNRYHYQRRRRHDDHLHLDANVGDFATLGEIIPDEALEIPEAVELAELRTNIAAAIKTLRPMSREILTALAVCGTYRATAEALGINLGTVKSRVARARDQLRGAMT